MRPRWRAVHRVLFLVGSGPGAELWERDGSDAGTHPVERAATVAGRALFYNQSFYDGGSAAINASDAIATDKSAFLPNGSLATFASVSSYSRGINGIMVDLSGGSAHASITCCRLRGHADTVARSPGEIHVSPSQMPRDASNEQSRLPSLEFANHSLARTSRIVLRAALS